MIEATHNDLGHYGTKTTLDVVTQRYEVASDLSDEGKMVLDSSIPHQLVPDEYSRRKYSFMSSDWKLGANGRLNSSRLLERTIKIRIEYYNIQKCRPLTETMVKAIKPLTIFKTLLSKQADPHILISRQFVQQPHHPCFIIRGFHAIGFFGKVAPLVRQWVMPRRVHFCRVGDISSIRCSRFSTIGISSTTRFIW